MTTQAELLEGLPPEVVERVISTALRPLPPVEAMILRLEQERMNLERDRLEVERLGLQVAQLQQRAAATPAPPAPTPTPAPTPASKPAPRPTPSTPKPPARQASQPRVPARKPQPPWLLLASATGVACLLTVVLGVTFREKPAPSTAKKTGSSSKTSKAGDAKTTRSLLELRQLMTELSEDLDMLALDDPAVLRRELARLRKVYRILKASKLGRARPDDIMALGARLDSASEVASAADPFPKVTASASPLPTPSPSVDPSPTPSPTASPRPAPTASPAPTPTDEPARPKLSPERLRFRAQGLMVGAFRAYDAEKQPDLERVLAALTDLGPDLEQTRVAHGLLLFLRARYADAYTKLINTTERDQRVILARVKAAYFTRHYAEARKALEGLSPALRRIWQRLVDGPFRGEFPNAADAVETITPDGRYRVITDLGLHASFLPRLEEKLASIPLKRRAAFVASAKRSHKSLAVLASIMDKASRAYSKLFSSEAQPQVTPTVYVFRTEAQFQAFSAGIRIGSTESTLGYYLPSVRALFFYDQGKKDRRAVLSSATQEVLLHETFHQWVHLHIEDAPHWFDEGLAEYFGYSEITKQGLRYGLIPKTNASTYSRLEAIRGSLNGSIKPAPMDLADLIRADGRTFMRRPGLSYAQAWSFMHYLMSTKTTRGLLNRYFHALRKGADRNAAYQQVFAKVDMKALDQAWRTYVGKMR